MVERREVASYNYNNYSAEVPCKLGEAKWLAIALKKKKQTNKLNGTSKWKKKNMHIYEYLIILRFCVLSSYHW